MAIGGIRPGHQPAENKKAMGTIPWPSTLIEPWVILLTHGPLCQ